VNRSAPQRWKWFVAGGCALVAVGVFAGTCAVVAGDRQRRRSSAPSGRVYLHPTMGLIGQLVEPSRRRSAAGRWTAHAARRAGLAGDRQHPGGRPLLATQRFADRVPGEAVSPVADRANHQAYSDVVALA
jgi:hypothetical protein